MLLVWKIFGWFFWYVFNFKRKKILALVKTDEDPSFKYRDKDQSFDKVSLLFLCLMVVMFCFLICFLVFLLVILMLIVYALYLSGMKDLGWFFWYVFNCKRKKISSFVKRDEDFRFEYWDKNQSFENFSLFFGVSVSN